MTHSELNAAGFDVSADAHALLDRFVTALLDENRRLNLTAIRDASTAWSAHVCDSLALLPILREATVTSLLDLGAGGGVPGLPLACAAPDLAVTLLDATRKKIDAVRRIADRLHLTSTRCMVARAEVAAHDPQLRESFDAVTARAVAALPVLIEYAAGFVRVGGNCWFFKTAVSAEDEIAAGANAAERCGLRLHAVRRYHIPGPDAGERALVGFDKVRSTPDDLPRPPGRAAKRPL